jgi:hypothetical protein
MTGQEAWDTITREAAEAGVEFGPAGQDPSVQAHIVKQMDEMPATIPHFLAAARKQIAERAQ